jgi:hypothetical protein
MSVIQEEKGLRRFKGFAALAETIERKQGGATSVAVRKKGEHTGATEPPTNNWQTPLLTSQRIRGKKHV